MTAANVSGGGLLNAGFLRFMARIAFGWIVFFSLLPDLIMRLLGVRISQLSGITWGIGVLLACLVAGYLSMKILRQSHISRFVFAGMVLLAVTQFYRISVSLGLFTIPAADDWRYVIRGFDNFFTGLGLVMIGWALVHMIIEILASRQELLAEHAKLSAEIDRRKTVEKELRAREELLGGINNSALDGIIVMDKEGCITYWNPAAERILGYRAEEVMGKPVYEMFSPLPDHNENVKDLLSWQHVEQSPVVGRTTALKGVRKDSAELDIELSISAMNADDKWHAVGILRDVTERKQAEQEYKILLKTAMDGFFLVTHAGRIMEVNDAYCAMIGYSRDELMQMSIQDVEAMEGPEETATHLKKILDTGFDRFETRHRRKDGTTIDVEVSVNPGAPGKRDRFCVFLRDTTERKRMDRERRELEIQVQHSQKLEGLGVLAGGIAHDFNNILQIILGTVNMMEKEVFGNASLTRFIERLKKAVDRASLLTHQMLAYSGRRGFELQALNIGEIAGEIVQFMQSSISKKVTVTTKFAAALPLIEADVPQIEQVVMNLVLNACEALDDTAGGVVTLSTKTLYCTSDYLSESRALFKASEGNYVCLEVADNGCGMNAETMEKLFDPFYTTKFTGRGLGMSAVLGIIRAHKGAILVDSAPGKGTTIRALFPLSGYVAPIPARETSDRVSPGASQPQRTVLIVDDEPDVLDLGVGMLELLGYSVLTAKDGIAAVELFKEQHEDINCVLLDLSMPHMDGIQTYQELRRIRPDVCVILASGYAEQDLGPRLTEYNIAAFLEKPFDVSALSEILEKVMGIEPVS